MDGRFDDLFAEMYASKLGCSAKALKKGLWGDWYYHPKSKGIIRKKASGGKLKPLFVQLVLDPIWKLYHAAEAESTDIRLREKPEADGNRSRKWKSQRRI